LIWLDDESLDALKTAATPLAPWQRDLFLKTVARELGQASDAQNGAGTVAKVARAVQKRILDGALKPPRAKRERATGG
jgi:hypothetical protein